jgi:hypothetical protein
VGRPVSIHAPSKGWRATREVQSTRPLAKSATTKYAIERWDEPFQSTHPAVGRERSNRLNGTAPIHAPEHRRNFRMPILIK